MVRIEAETIPGSTRRKVRLRLRRRSLPRTVTCPPHTMALCFGDDRSSRLPSGHSAKNRYEHGTRSQRSPRDRSHEGGSG